MEENSKQQSSIVHYCYSKTSRDSENYIPEHALSFLMSGTQELYMNDKKYTFQEGDIRFFAREQLGRFVKIPPADGQFNVMTVRLDRNTLLDMSHGPQAGTKDVYQGERVINLPRSPLLLNFFESLKPYCEDENYGSDAHIKMKVREAVVILLEMMPALNNLLFDFTTPGKVDLESFMLKNYRYNVNIDRFAYLTGRSLATFKRDFKSLFGMPPHAWLMQQRLNKAHELLRVNGLSVWDIFEEVGFKDYTHFSFAFKKAFGYPPSTISRNNIPGTITT